MKRAMHPILILVICLSVLCSTALGFDCTPRTYSGPSNIQPYSAGCGLDPGLHTATEYVTLYKSERRSIIYPDGVIIQLVDASSTGQCRLWYQNCHLNVDLGFCWDSGSSPRWNDPHSYCWRQYYSCWPLFYTPEYYSDGRYIQTLYRQSVAITEVSCCCFDVRDDPYCVQGPSDDTVNRQHSCPIACTPPGPQLAQQALLQTALKDVLGVPRIARI
jgi:hypothetical protein